MSEDAPEPEEMPEGRGLDRSRIDESLHQAFNPQPIAWGVAADGLASPQIPGHLPLAPPLSPETLVCLGDHTEYVLRSSRWGDVVGRFNPKEVTRSPSGEHYVPLEVAIASGAKWREVFRKLDIFSGRVRVEPLRPQCKFFAQQMTPFQGDSERQSMERLCTARRDENSFFLGLQDQQIFACELRNPRDRASEERIEKMNHTKIVLGRERIKEPGAFDVDQALDRAESEAERGLSESSIFDDKR